MNPSITGTLVIALILCFATKESFGVDFCDELYPLFDTAFTYSTPSATNLTHYIKRDEYLYMVTFDKDYKISVSINSEDKSKSIYKLIGKSKVYFNVKTSNKSEFQFCSYEKYLKVIKCEDNIDSYVMKSQFKNFSPSLVFTIKPNCPLFVSSMNGTFLSKEFTESEAKDCENGEINANDILKKQLKQLKPQTLQKFKGVLHLSYSPQKPTFMVFTKEWHKTSYYFFNTTQLELNQSFDFNPCINSDETIGIWFSIVLIFYFIALILIPLIFVFIFGAKDKMTDTTETETETNP